jgi:hypothetical protein
MINNREENNVSDYTVTAYNQQLEVVTDEADGEIDILSINDIDSEFFTEYFYDTVLEKVYEAKVDKHQDYLDAKADTKYEESKL